jgi:predicted nuclease with RNAse H fold
VKRPFRTFLGVDLGGGKGKSTAVARLALDERDELVVEEVLSHTPAKAPWYDGALLEYLRAHSAGAVLGIDAPLTLTACVRCAEPVCPGTERCVDPAVVWFRTIGDDRIAAATDRKRNGKPLTTPYTQRATEVWLQTERKILPRETLGQGMGPLTARASHLRRALGPGYQLNENLLEVYPRASVLTLFGDAARGYKHDREVRQALLHRLELRFGPRTGFQRTRAADVDHCFDAVVCAFTAYLWARDGWELPEESRSVYAEDGWIWIPPVAS